MKIPPNGIKDQTERQRAGNKVLMPISITVFILAFYSSNDIVMKFIIGVVLGFLGYTSFHAIRTYKEQLHGSSLKRFKELYAELLEHTKAVSIIAVTTVISSMADLMGTDFTTAHKYLQLNSFIFGKVTYEIPLFTTLIMRTEEIEQIYVILHLPEEELPEFLTSPCAYYRQAAMLRMSYVRPGNRDEIPSDPP